MSDTGLLNSSMVMDPRLQLSLNITLQSTTPMVLILMMLRTTSRKRVLLKDIQRQKKLNLRTHSLSWKSNATSFSQLLLRNQFTKETPLILNAKLLSKVLTDHQLLLEKKSLLRKESLYAQIF